MWVYVWIWVIGFFLNGCVVVELMKLLFLEGIIDVYCGVLCEVKRLFWIFIGIYVFIVFWYCVYDVVMIYFFGVVWLIYFLFVIVLDRVMDVDNLNFLIVIFSSMIN